MSPLRLFGFLLLALTASAETPRPNILWLIAEDFARAYRDCDVIAGPTAPTTAFPLGAQADDPVQMYLNDIFTVAANLTGAPALSIPCGFDGGGLPVGLQLQGDYFSEAALVNVAHRYQQVTDWHQRRPPHSA